MSKKVKRIPFCMEKARTGKSYFISSIYTNPLKQEYNFVGTLSNGEEVQYSHKDGEVFIKPKGWIEAISDKMYMEEEIETVEVITIVTRNKTTEEIGSFTTNSKDWRFKSYESSEYSVGSKIGIGFEVIARFKEEVEL